MPVYVSHDDITRVTYQLNKAFEDAALYFHNDDRTGAITYEILPNAGLTGWDALHDKMNAVMRDTLKDKGPFTRVFWSATQNYPDETDVPLAKIAFYDLRIRPPHMA